MNQLLYNNIYHKKKSTDSVFRYFK